MATAIRGAAITPALLFTFVFNSLLVGARKRVIKAVYVASANRKPAQDEPVPDAPILDGRISNEPSSQAPVSGDASSPTRILRSSETLPRRTD
jgi:hypothetical protein